MIIAITGASGVGKTTVVDAIGSGPEENPKTFHLDDVDMPDWSSLEDAREWQRETTLKWVERLVNIVRNEKVDIVFEGSSEIEFLREGFHQHRFTDYEIILFDCNPQTMKSRLTERGQPDLYHADMLNWLKKLRLDAMREGIQIVETDHKTIDEIADIITDLISKDEV